uniref:RNA-directed RNA polymerase n=1 Tax=Leveillula taurica associated chu-like virus 1 TaxID=2754856 RepID=A0A7D6ERH3_9VIRU|nr:putative RdRp [Leveillula taurica associated chu-like virus 1]
MDEFLDPLDVPQHSSGPIAAYLVYERKFDIALRKTHCENTLKELVKIDHDSEYIEQVSNEIYLVSKLLYKLELSVYDVNINVNIFPSLFLDCIKSPYCKTNKSANNKILHVITEVVKAQSDTYKYNNEKLLPLKLNEYVEELTHNLAQSPEISRLCKAKNQLDILVNKTSKTNGIRVTRANRHEMSDTYLAQASGSVGIMGAKVYWTQSHCIIVKDQQYYLLPKSYMLLIHNKLHDILSVLVLASFYPDMTYKTHCLTTTLVWIKEYAGLAVRMKHNFHELAKVLEALVIGMTLRKEEGVGNVEFLRSVSKGLEEAVGFDFLSSNLYHQMQDMTIPLLHEVGCLSKIMGHPFCDIEAAAEQFHDRCTEENPIDPQMVAMSVQMAKKDLLEGYINKYNKWPPVVVYKHKRLFAYAYNLGISPFSPRVQKKHGLCKLSYMDELEFEPFEKFDRLENFLPYVKDRTISLVRDVVIPKYITQQDIKVNWANTKALLAYLFLPYEDTEHLSYLEMYTHEDWDLMSNYLIIRLIPKELEHKRNPRYFGCKPAVERARTSVISENTAHMLHKYSDSDAMTQSELTLIKKLYAFRNTYQLYKDYHQIIICLDASGWSGRQRAAANAPVAKATFDKAFGNNMCGLTHTAYHHTFFYIPDVDKVYSWDGQAGGIDGQDQYYWVWSYIAQLKSVMTIIGYPFRLLVKGDDVRIVILIPPYVYENKTIDDIKRQVVKRITELSKMYGHVMKPEDSYASSTYCTFSKNAFVCNSEQPQSFRKCQKAYGANNAFMNTIDEYAASSFSNCHSTSKTSPTPIACYLLSLWWFIQSLLGSKHYKHLTVHQLSSLCLVPNMLGGFPVIYLHNYYQRAESDLLSSFIGMYLVTRRYNSQLFDELSKFMCQVVLPAKENVQMLCIDPYSLPLHKPSGAKSVLKLAIRDVIAKETKNETIASLFESKNTTFTEKIIRMLTDSNIYNPKIMSLLYSCSPDGIITELVAKFESGKSIMDAILLKGQRNSASAVMRKALNAERRLHQFRLQIITNRLQYAEELPVDFSKCPAENAQIIRERLWKKPIEGVTQPPVWHVVTIGSLREMYPMGDYADLNHFDIKWDVPTAHSKYGVLFTFGKTTPFLGDSTSKGLTNPSVSIVSNNIFASKITNLIDLYRWTTLTGQAPPGKIPYSDIISEMILKYTTKPITDFLPFAGHKPFGRTTQHHLRANQYRPSIVPNTLQNVYTWCLVNMESHVNLFNKLIHSSFNYHEIRCWIVSYLSTNVWCGYRPNSNGQYWAVTTNCKYCTRPIVESDIVTTHIPLPKIGLVENFKHAESAITTIIEEVNDFNPEEYYVPEETSDLTIPLCIQACCQYIISSTWHNIVSVIDDQVQHAVRLSAVSNMYDWAETAKIDLLGSEDLKFMNVIDIFEALYTIVASYVISTYKASSITQLMGLMGIIPSISLPWTIVLKQLNKINKMRELQLHVNKILNKTHVIIDNHETYSGVFGVLCYEYFLRRVRKDYSITYTSDKFGKEVPKYLSSRIKSTLTLRVWGELIALDRTKDSYHNLEIPVYMVIAIYRLNLQLGEPIIFNNDNDGRIQEVDYSCISSDDDIDVLDELGMFISDDTSELIESLKTAFKYDWDSVLTNIIDGNYDTDMLYDMDRNVCNDLGPITVRITKVNLLSVKKYLNEEGIVKSANYNTPNVDEDDQEGATVEVNVRRGSLFMNFPYYSDVQATTEFMIQDVDINPPVYQYDIFPLHAVWAKRLYGSGNISASREVELLHNLGIKEFNDNINVAIFADGYGGTMMVVDKLTKNSNFVFVTSPTALGTKSYPVGNLVNEGNKLLAQNIVTDRWDLSEPTNLMRLEEYHPLLYSYVTCDAELIGDLNNDTGYYSIWSLVTAFALRNMLPGGILRIKVYLQFTKSILKLVSMLHGQCKRILLIQSEPSGWIKELYLVAVISSNLCMNYYDAQRLPVYPGARIQTRLEEFMHAYVEHNRSRDKPVESIDYYNIVSKLRHYLDIPNYGFGMMIQNCKICVSQATLIKRIGESMDNYRSRCNPLFADISKPYLNVITGNTASNETDISHHYETHTHYLYALCKYATIYAFIKIVMHSQYNNVLTSQYLSDLWDGFLRRYRMDLYGKWTYDELLKDKKAMLIKDYDLFSFFMGGVRWGISHAAWGKTIQIE